MAPLLASFATLTRRSLLRRSALAGGGLVAGTLLPARAFPQATAPAVITSEKMRPTLPSGVQTGDLLGDRAVLWARADRPARMMVDWATGESFEGARTLRGPAALEDTDFTAKLDLAGLPPGQKIHYRVTMVDLADPKLSSEPVAGSFWTPPAARQNVRFVWSGDTAGQGWGINLDWGGMKAYEAMRQVEPAFFIHSGDTIYADGPLAAEVKLPDGSVWKNVTTAAKAKVAETLAEFRGNYAYNLMDEHVRRFNAEVPMFAQWDDHEVTNNWYPGEDLTGDPNKAAYKVTSVDLLAARALRAFQEYVPIRRHLHDPERVYAAFGYGPSLDVLRLDMRSYRGPNTTNDQAAPSPDTAFLGSEQIRWLKQALLASDATWKVVAADMPIGLLVRDGETAFENGANGPGPARGRELEIADLLSFIHRNGIRNVVWLTADVHYTAAHYYDPNAAQFQDFRPFWEFVSGPLNAGTFGPGELDDTFGPKVMFQKHPPDGQSNLPPSAGLQFFGQVDIDGASEVMTVRLKDLTGATLFTQELEPEV
ncbi:MAG TPA: alkaline phosphatase D family protein [Geminicoccaceae bacterium]|nr:alkaline phosphatase D family protein [Geminicoccaceae bacterium]